MKHTMIASKKQQQVVYRHRLINELYKHNIGTNEVENLSKKICKELPKRRQKTLSKMVMKWKLHDAYEKLRRERDNNIRIWRIAKRKITENGVYDRYQRLWMREKKEYNDILIDKRKRKVTFLKCRYKEEKTTPNEIEGITIEDQEITSSFTSVPRCYGNA